MPTLLTLIFGLNFQTGAQTPGELATGSYGSAGSGPSATQQWGRLLLNTTGTTYAMPKTNVRVTASVSNQQYTGVGTGTGNPVLMFGATNNGSASNATSRPIYAAMTDIGSPTNAMYTNQANGTAGGIDVATNFAFNMYTSVHQWAGTTTPAIKNRTYMADLTLSFSVPLTNPMLQIVGIGGSVGTMGFSSELDLITPGLTMTKLQGNSALAVTNTQINNANSTGLDASCSANAAGCGTVRVNGTNISSITFKVYIRGDSDGTQNWDTSNRHSGDQWLIGLSIPETFSVSGNVFNDANGMSDNTVNGTGIGNTGGAQLYANLVEPVSGKIIGTVPVNSNGSYNFDGVPAGANVRVEISTTQGTDLTAAPAKLLTFGWGFSGEHIGTNAGGTNPGTGALSFTVTGNVTNVNFGLINFGPTAASVTVGGRVMTYKGAGIRNVFITLTDANGDTRTVLTGPFGYYRFDNVNAGETYVVTATGKRFRFDQPMQVLNLSGDMDDVNFYGFATGMVDSR